VTSADPERGAAVSTRGLSKRFRSGQVAVDDIDLHVPRGAVFGFLGPNGSGKTTTLRMLVGLVAPTAGEVQLLGEPMPARAGVVLPRVGALIEGPAFHPYLSGRGNLVRLDAVDATADPDTTGTRIAAALERVGLAAAANKRFRQYSLGMKQRLGIAAALLQPRTLLVLDEPTNGLDPQGTREVRTLVRALAADGTTVLLSSHLLAEIEQVCSHIGIMSRGRLLRQGPLDQLGSADTATVTVTTTPDGVSGAARVLDRLHLRDVQTHNRGATALLGDTAPEDVTVALVAAAVRVQGLAVSRPSLEDLFVQLTGEGFDVAR